LHGTVGRKAMNDPYGKLTRREFAGSSLAIGISALGAMPLSQAGSQQASGQAAGFLDIHTHITQGWFEQERGPLSVRHLLHWMDGHRVAQAVVLPLVSPESFWYPVTTEYVLRETLPHRDRLIPFCAIDPRALATHLPEKQQVVDMLERYRDAGARGFGEHKPMLPIDDPLNMKLYDACCEVKFPVLFHLDNYANMDRPGLPGLARVLKSLPDLIMIGHGKGWWASIAGNLRQEDLQTGFPRGPVAPGGAIDALMGKFPNLYADLSSSGSHAIFRDREFGKGFLKRHSERLLFGTDYYDLTQNEFEQFDLFNAFELTADEAANIAGNNARRLLRLT